MTSQSLTISARHTSSTVPTRLQRRHSLRGNEWRAIARAWIAEVQRPFLSHHSPRRSIAPAVGDIPMSNLTLQAAHTMVRSGGTADTRADNASLTYVSVRCVPPNHAIPGAPWCAHYIPFAAIPNPLAKSADQRSPPATTIRGRAPCAHDKRVNKISRIRARASRALKEACEHERGNAALQHDIPATLQRNNYDAYGTL